MTAQIFTVVVSTVFSMAACAILVSTYSLFRGGSIYIGSPGRVVQAMVRMADIQPGEKVYDLGCGDARLLISAQRQCRATGIGIDISGTLLATAWLRSKLWRSPLKLIKGNIIDVDFSDADVVFCYLMPELLGRVDHKLRALKPGTRIISHQFELVGWQPVSEMVVASHPFLKVLREYRVGLPMIRTDAVAINEDPIRSRIRWHASNYGN